MKSTSKHHVPAITRMDPCAWSTPPISVYSYSESFTLVLIDLHFHSLNLWSWGSVEFPDVYGA